MLRTYKITDVKVETTREKQIEEIILIVKGTVADNAAIDFEKDRILFDGNDLDHLAEQIAEHITAKGYRKASEVAREIFEGIEVWLDGSRYSSSEMVWGVKHSIEELKKKYTEGGE